MDLLGQYGEWKNGRYEYMVLSREGDVIAPPRRSTWAKVDASWLEGASEADFGSLVQQADGQERIICYAQARQPWYIALVASPDVFTGAVPRAPGPI